MVCGVFGPFLFPYVLAFYTNQTVLMVVVTYCGGRYLVSEIGLLGYKENVKFVEVFDTSNYESLLM